MTTPHHALSWDPSDLLAARRAQSLAFDKAIDEVHPSHRLSGDGGWCLNCDSLVCGEFMGATPKGLAPCVTDTSADAAYAWLRS